MFTTLALVGMLIVPLNAFPWVLNGILEAKVSLDRIQRFFKLTNQDLQAYYALGRLPLSCLSVEVEEFKVTVRVFIWSRLVESVEERAGLLNVHLIKVWNRSTK